MFRFPLYTITPVLIQAIQQQQLASLNTIACILKTQVKVYNLCSTGGKGGPSHSPLDFIIQAYYMCVYTYLTHTHNIPPSIGILYIYIKCIFFPPERAKLFFSPPQLIVRSIEPHSFVLCELLFCFNLQRGKMAVHAYTVALYLRILLYSCPAVIK